jgi:hypothetical protein
LRECGAKLKRRSRLLTAIDIGFGNRFRSRPSVLIRSWTKIGPRPKGTTLSDQLKTISSPANAMEARPMNVRPPRTARVKSDM